MKQHAASSTAYLVLYHVELAACEPAIGKHVNEESRRWSQAFLASSLFWRSAAQLARTRLPRWCLRKIESLYIPGLGLHQLLRKLELERIARASIADGARQVIVLGAGLDSRALRLCKDHRELTFFELDHPNTQALKLRVVERSTAAQQNLHFVALDLAGDEPWKPLREHKLFKPAAKSLILCEGVLMYLDEAVIERVLRGVPTTADCELAFSFLRLDARGRPAFGGSPGPVDAWLRVQRESFRWGIPPTALGAFLQPLGFELRTLSDAREHRERHLPHLPSSFACAEGEHLAIATRTEQSRAQRSG
jgi:methyltransferase (TIGR00027 family)